jgi:glycosyltransferase involved in cell wall biosynthesis
MGSHAIIAAMTEEAGVSELRVTRGPRVHPNPRVSVVIPAWFRTASPGTEWLDEALDSVRAQDFPDWEIILVDDGSPVPVAPTRCDDLVLIRQANVGPGGARNTGARHARGEFVAYIDADDRWRADKLGKQVAFLDANPEMVLVCTDILLIDKDGFTPLRTARQKGVVVGNRIPFEKLFHENCVGSATVMVRRAVLEKTPGMNPRQRLGEEYGLWLRLAMLGPIGYLEEALMERRRHGDSLMFTQLGDGSWIAREREVYESFLSENPELRTQPFVRKAMARLAFQGGWTHLARGEWREARRLLVESLRGDPTRMKAWVDLVRAVLHLGPRRRAQAP